MAAPPIRGLQQLARMKLDAELTTLRVAALRRDADRAALAALNRPDAATPDLSPIAAGLAVLRYQRWAEARRAEINIRLARHTAEWMEARDSAARAFGRAEALDAIARKMKGGK